VQRDGQPIARAEELNVYEPRPACTSAWELSLDARTAGDTNVLTVDHNAEGNTPRRGGSNVSQHEISFELVRGGVRAWHFEASSRGVQAARGQLEPGLARKLCQSPILFGGKERDLILKALAYALERFRLQRLRVDRLVEGRSLALSSRKQFIDEAELLSLGLLRLLREPDLHNDEPGDEDRQRELDELKVVFQEVSAGSSEKAHHRMMAGEAHGGGVNLSGSTGTLLGAMFPGLFPRP